MICLLLFIDTKLESYIRYIIQRSKWFWNTQNYVDKRLDILVMKMIMDDGDLQ